MVRDGNRLDDGPVVIRVVRLQIPGPLKAPLAGLSGSRCRSLRRDLSALASPIARLVRRARRLLLATPSPLPKKEEASWRILRLAAPFDSDGLFPLSHSEDRQDREQELARECRAGE